MHTIMVLAGGFGLLGICLLVGRLVGGSIARSALAFLPLWLFGAGINLWVGVDKAGYTVKEELPVFFVLFALPASAALGVWWRQKAG